MTEAEAVSQLVTELSKARNAQHRAEELVKWLRAEIVLWRKVTGAEKPDAFTIEHLRQLALKHMPDGFVMLEIQEWKSATGCSTPREFLDVRDKRIEQIRRLL